MPDFVPEKVIERLKQGNKRFMEGETNHTAASALTKLKEYAVKGQSPKAIILCCSDSRAPVELIFDQNIGDLFVIRVAGNIVAPSLVGSIEFAASTFGTRLIVVMGHSGCGAIKSTLEFIEHAEIGSENIHDIVSRIKPHIYHLAKQNLSHEEKTAQAVEANVRASVEQLKRASHLLESGVTKGDLVIAGSILNLESGRVDWLGRALN